MTYASTMQGHKTADATQQQQAGAAELEQAAMPPTYPAVSTPMSDLEISLGQLTIAEPGLLPDSMVMQAAAQNKAFAQISAGPAGLAQDCSSTKVFETEECVVCWAAAACVILQPCGHMCMCEACSQVFKSPAVLCPMCRARVKGTIAVAA